MKKNVLMVIPNIGFGGAQRVFNDLSTVLSKHYNIIECAFNSDGSQYYSTGNQLVYLDIPAGGNAFSKAFYFLQRVQKLKALKKRYNIDICISHLEGADYINVLSSIGEKTVFCIHGSKNFDANIKGALGVLRKKVLIPFIYKFADSIVTVAQGVADELVQSYGIATSKISVINNGFDVDTISERSREDLDGYKSLFDKPVLITHGRIAREKDQRLLVRLASDERLKGKVRSVIIGDGPLYNELVHASQSSMLRTYDSKVSKVMELDYDVYFLGFQSNPFRFLARSFAFIFPSLNEGFPMALVEAMSCGIPVIASDCPYGPKEILTENESNGDPVYFGRFGVLISLKLDEEARYNHWVSTVQRMLADDVLCNNYRTTSIERSRDFSLARFELNWKTTLDQLSDDSKA